MTLDEARLMANVNARAQRLFEDGYRARWTGPPLAGRLQRPGGRVRSGHAGRDLQLPVLRQERPSLQQACPGVAPPARAAAGVPPVDRRPAPSGVEQS